MVIKETYIISIKANNKSVEKCIPDCGYGILIFCLYMVYTGFSRHPVVEYILGRTDKE